MKKRIFIILLLSAVCAFGVMFAAGCNISTGKFYTLQEAYDNGFLTQEDLMSIAYYHNKGRIYNEEIMSEDYTPMPKTPEVLSSEIEKAICKNYWDEHYEEHKTDSNTINDVGVGEYYGTYNNCVVVKVWIGVEATPCETYKDTVGGVVIYYNNLKLMVVWVKS